MILAALLLSWPLQQDATTALTQFRQQSEAKLLAGEALAPDYRQHLATLPPAERIEAIIFLRRIGLLTGRAWQVDDLLSPAVEVEGADK